jgi:LPS-assembly lipoprotein
MRLANLALVLLLSITLAGCGWQLRGAAGGGFGDLAIAIEGGVSQPILDQVGRQLRDLDARVVADRQAAERVLVIRDVRVDRRTVATDADGFAEAYELRYRIDFRLEPGERSGGDVDIGQVQTVRATAAYAAAADDNRQGMQAEDAEAEALERDLREQAIDLLLARVSRQL